VQNLTIFKKSTYFLLDNRVESSLCTDFFFCPNPFGTDLVEKRIRRHQGTIKSAQLLSRMAGIFSDFTFFSKVDTGFAQ